jgi:hypothetical protein
MKKFASLLKVLPAEARLPYLPQLMVKVVSKTLLGFGVKHSIFSSHIIFI